MAIALLHLPHISMDPHILGLKRYPLQLGILGVLARACTNPTVRRRTTTGASLWGWGRGIKEEKELIDGPEMKIGSSELEH